MQYATGDDQEYDLAIAAEHGDLPGSLVTFAFYAAEYGGRPGEYGVQRQVEWMVCRDPADPGGTEIWSDVEHTDVSIVHPEAGIAEREAHVFAAECLRGAREGFEWDGQPPRNGDR